MSCQFVGGKVGKNFWTKTRQLTAEKYEYPPLKGKTPKVLISRLNVLP